MDTLSVFLVDLQHRWGFRGLYPQEDTVCSLLYKHLGISHVPYLQWNQSALTDILKAVIERMDRENRGPIAFDDPIGKSP